MTGLRTGLRVLLAEDQAVVRDGLRLLLELHGLEVVAVEDGRQAVEAVDAAVDAAARGGGRSFDVAVLDVRMPVLDGIGCVRALRARYPELPILMLTTYDDDRLVRECLAAGADAYLLKDIAAEDLVNAVRLLAAGGGLIPGDLARRLTAGTGGQDPAHAGSHGPGGSGESRDAGGSAGGSGDGAGSSGPGGGVVLEVLTPRQREVLDLIAQGLSNREIAQRLFLSEGTVKNAVSEIYARLDVRDRVQAVLKAREMASGDGEPGRPPGR